MPAELANPRCIDPVRKKGGAPTEYRRLDTDLIVAIQSGRSNFRTRGGVQTSKEGSPVRVRPPALVHQLRIQQAARRRTSLAPAPDARPGVPLDAWELLQHVDGPSAPTPRLVVRLPRLRPPRDARASLRRGRRRKHVREVVADVVIVAVELGHPDLSGVDELVPISAAIARHLRLHVFEELAGPRTEHAGPCVLHTTVEVHRDGLNLLDVARVRRVSLAVPTCLQEVCVPRPLVLTTILVVLAEAVTDSRRD
mmetsp:Transcript_66913/g.192383  ORF Transcript_66913/g.192383 Transcript_66913/m.192383 type:complete len:253 (+) Transcript_66913:192-950(+)